MGQPSDQDGELEITKVNEWAVALSSLPNFRVFRPISLFRGGAGQISSELGCKQAKGPPHHTGLALLEIRWLFT